MSCFVLKLGSKSPLNVCSTAEEASIQCDEFCNKLKSMAVSGGFRSPSEKKMTPAMLRSRATYSYMSDKQNTQFWASSPVACSQ